MQTQAEGSTSADACLAPPGWGFDATSGTAAVCPLGWYSEGWSREPCTRCGGGTLTTAAVGSTSADDCFAPAGHSVTKSADGVTLVGAPCPIGTWGRSEPTYGLVETECAECPDHSSTLAEASTSSLACLVDPGYGWEDGAVLQCDYGYWSAGGTHNPCTYCGVGYNTSATPGGGTTAAITGAISKASCAIAAGWTPDGGGGGGIKPCVKGFYKELLGASACVACPVGTTTTLMTYAVARSDCDACAPGYGNPAIDPAAPACAACASGSFSFGNKAGGSECQECPKPAGYTCRMVSRMVSCSLFYLSCTFIPATACCLHAVCCQLPDPTSQQ